METSIATATVQVPVVAPVILACKYFLTPNGMRAANTDPAAAANVYVPNVTGEAMSAVSEVVSVTVAAADNALATLPTMKHCS